MSHKEVSHERIYRNPHQPNHSDYNLLHPSLSVLALFQKKYDSKIYSVYHVQIFSVKSVINPVIRICRIDLHLPGWGGGVGKYRGVMWWRRTIGILKNNGLFFYKT